MVTLHFRRINKKDFIALPVGVKTILNSWHVQRQLFQSPQYIINQTLKLQDLEKLPQHYFTSQQKNL
jgi:hypothetical protein